MKALKRSFLLPSMKIGLIGIHTPTYERAANMFGHRDAFLTMVSLDFAAVISLTRICILLLLQSYTVPLPRASVESRRRVAQ
jgi:hypothetical protein